MTLDEMRIAGAEIEGKIVDRERMLIVVKNKKITTWFEIPNYPEDANDALRLCGVMDKLGWRLTLTIDQEGPFKGQFAADFTTGTYAESDYVSVSVCDPSAPLAITLAALRAMGKGEEK